jgi:hypothetical protein
MQTVSQNANIRYSVLHDTEHDETTYGPILLDTITMSTAKVESHMNAAMSR